VDIGVFPLLRDFYDIDKFRACKLVKLSKAIKKIGAPRVSRIHCITWKVGYLLLTLKSETEPKPYP